MPDLARYWYRQSLHFFTFLLLPFSWLFGFIITIRQWLYRVGIIKTSHFDIPIIVVGNITVGGTGKTPFVIWLAQFLREQGYHPGIVSRGVGGKKQVKPHRVTAQDAAEEVGDEALLLLQSDCPVVIGINRSAAVEMLLNQTSCNIVISDDGLQHYRLGRNIEIIMVDGLRQFGNRHLLPAGPLREPMKRLNQVDFVVTNGGGSDALTMTLEPLAIISLQDKQNKMKLDEFSSRKIHAVAAIGHPERFFQMLENAGFEVIPHSFPDHYHYQANDFNFSDSLPILMTEKDAVKCKAFADHRFWYVSVTANIHRTLQQQLLAKLTSIGA